MEEEKRDRRENLRRFIFSQIDKRGPLPFSQFMDWCLYHPEYGYYQSGGVRIGKDGDYYTGPSVSPLFGHAIARQLFQMSEILGEDVFDVVEMGGGRGFLCEDILDWAKKSSPPFYQKLRYRLVETSAPFSEEQRKRLSEKEKEGRVFWIDPKKFEAGEVQAEGCFLSNELVDAFPVHRVVFDQGELKEIYVTRRNGRFEEQWGRLSDPGIAFYFRSMKIALQEGQKAEVNLAALEWMERVAQCLRRGLVLTIDYGYLADELYSPIRREGTLLCYRQHQASENPYERLGEQDITSHVNFTSLIRKGEEVGLRFTGLVPQYRFLIGLGLLDQMETLGKELSELDALKLRLSVKNLIEPEMGMGEVFKVLVQHKGMDQPQLDGLRDLASIPFPASVEEDRRPR